MATQNSEAIRVERSEGVMKLTLNRPHRRNAITMGMFATLREACDQAALERDIRVLVITGAGGIFSSGADLTPGEGEGQRPREKSSVSASTTSLIREEVHTAILALHRLAIPTVAVVPGDAAGAGANLALACDLVLAARDARFSQIFVKRALSLDCGGSWLLPRLVGLQKAKELAFFGDWVSAATAEELGLVNRVCPEEELAGLGDEWANRLAQQAPVALSLIKQSLNRSFASSMEEALDQEAVNQGVCTATNDFREGIAAFVEKREPTFTGG
ncbi:enoyl-CoA hydratase-related protein [Myxococcota bacterium]|nr:enoyl-CoA hydratase-related protein [Myxococcota bacterium]